MPETLDPRKVMTGHDGRLYAEVNGKSICLMNVDTFQSQLNFSNIDFNAVGNRLTYAIPGNVSVSLTITEAVVTDAITMKPILDALAAGKKIVFNFRGVLDREYDKQQEDISYQNCIPDGTWDVQNLTPNDVIKRSLAFRVNSIPKALKTLTGM